MAKYESVEKKLQRIRSPGVQLAYKLIPSLAPRTAFQVKNTLTAEDSRMSVDLTFDSMQDFHSENIVKQGDLLYQLAKARERLTDLRNKVSKNERLEDLLDEILQDPDQVRKLSNIK